MCRGLGKTLQTLSFLYTVLKQGPRNHPLVKKALVVAPSSLTENWKREIKKWLGDEKLRCCILAGQQLKEDVVAFKHGMLYPVAVASYETMRKISSDLAGHVDIIIADEGHRLKSAAGNKTIAALNHLRCPRKIILSGTPLQNNLGELFAMCDFVNPGCLGPLATFQKVFERAIVKSRDPDASEETVALGKKRSEELRHILHGFVLRRDASVNEAFLPKLSSYAVFCRPSDLQIEMMKRIIDARWDSDIYAKEEALVLLTKLRKVCGHPRLLSDDCESSAANDSSGKMHVLMHLLSHIVFNMSERAVVVSQWTSMLDIIQQACGDANISTVRLDGATPVSKRQDVVDSFNSHGVGSVFLLSTAAGGAGLNLIGSSKLILCDSAWNPALDNQAMARIWRDGQKKDCSVYRLLTTGTMEEKVYQRQMLKGDLAQVSVYGETADTQAGQRFSKCQLKELFEVELGTSCMTSDILEKMGASYKDIADDDDAALQAVRDSCPITFVYKETVNKSSPTLHQQDGDHRGDENKNYNNNTTECISIQGHGGTCNDGLSDLDIDTM